MVPPQSGGSDKSKSGHVAAAGGYHLLCVPRTAVGPEGWLQETRVVVGVVTLAMEEGGILNNQENARSSGAPSLTIPPGEKGTVVKVGGPEMGVGGPAVD